MSNQYYNQNSNESSLNNNILQNNEFQCNNLGECFMNTETVSNFDSRQSTFGYFVGPTPSSLVSSPAMSNIPHISLNNEQMFQTNHVRLNTIADNFKIELVVPCQTTVYELKLKIFQEFNSKLGTLPENPITKENFSTMKIQDIYKSQLSDLDIVGNSFKNDDTLFAIVNKLTFNNINNNNDYFSNEDIYSDDCSINSSINSSPHNSPPNTDFDPIYQQPSIYQSSLTISTVQRHAKSLKEPKKGDGRCFPYCEVTTNINEKGAICEKCQEVRPHILNLPPNESHFCTKWCSTNTSRKLKANSLEFCSICLSRQRTQKYSIGQGHQCNSCSRPWMILMMSGKCRRCHKEQDIKTKKEKKLNNGNITTKSNINNNDTINNNNYNNICNINSNIVSDNNNYNTPQTFNDINNLSFIQVNNNSLLPIELNQTFPQYPQHINPNFFTYNQQEIQQQPQKNININTFIL